MPLISTHDLEPSSLTAEQQSQVYCGLDCMVTLEVHQELNKLFNQPPEIYNFERALQAPYLEIMQRGFAVDGLGRQAAARGLRERIGALQEQLDEFARAVWDRPVNPRSPAQLKDFFYSSRGLGLPEVWLSQKGERKVSTNREALEKLEVYLYARPIIAIILTIRDLGKQCSVFETEIDSDGRFRASYNIAGTECVSGDSLIWTKGGLRKMKEIYETPHAVAVWNGDEFVTPTRKVRYADKVGKRIWLQGGYTLECSLNHPVLTRRGFVEAQNLVLGDSVELNNGLPVLFGQHALPRGGVIEQMSEDFCEFYGMMLADGTLNVNPEHKRARLANSDPQVKQRFLTLSKKVFGASGGESGDEVWFSSVHVCTWLKQLGFPADEGLGTATWKTIPAAILRGKPNLLRALLRGLTLDTHITEKGLMFGTQSFAMRSQIQQCLLVLGIVSNKLETGNSVKLNVPRAYCGRFISLIGFVQDSKLSKLAKLIGERCQWHEPVQPMTKTFFPVVQLDDWRGDVYDLTMPENSPPQYVAQGMTVHNTGRPSSSENAFGTGGNAQNIAPGLRYVFVADPGKKLCVIDLEQVEARDTGFFMGCLFGDWKFLNNCEQGDLHTNNSKLVWPELRWTGDAKRDRAVADQIFYRDFTYRDMAKRGGHLSGYYGTAWTMSRALKIPLKTAEDFQARYNHGPSCAFPGFARWWQWTAEQLQTTHTLITPFGRKRHFFGRPEDDTTLREAIAFLPQSTTADRMNLGLWRVWKHMPQVQLLAQTYDSITFQYDENADEAGIVAEALERIRVELKAPNGRTYVVPGEAKIGWNWMAKHNENQPTGPKNKANPDGLIKWKSREKDTRIRQSGLRRIML